MRDGGSKRKAGTENRNSGKASATVKIRETRIQKNRDDQTERTDKFYNVTQRHSLSQQSLPRRRALSPSVAYRRQLPPGESLKKHRCAPTFDIFLNMAVSRP